MEDSFYKLSFFIIFNNKEEKRTGLLFPVLKFQVIYYDFIFKYLFLVA